MNTRTLLVSGAILALTAFAGLGTMVRDEPCRGNLKAVAQALISGTGVNVDLGPTAVGATVVIAGERHGLEIVKTCGQAAACEA